jgi:hypothetical protein
MTESNTVRKQFASVGITDRKGVLHIPPMTGPDGLRRGHEQNRAVDVRPGPEYTGALEMQRRH